MKIGRLLFFGCIQSISSSALYFVSYLFKRCQQVQFYEMALSHFSGARWSHDWIGNRFFQ